MNPIETGVAVASSSFGSSESSASSPWWMKFNVSDGTS